MPIRWLVLLFLPLGLQMIGYMVALTATTGGGSFVGLLLMPIAMVATPLLILIGAVSCRKLPAGYPIGNRLLVQLTLALGPALLLILLRAIES